MRRAFGLGATNPAEGVAVAVRARVAVAIFAGVAGVVGRGGNGVGVVSGGPINALGSGFGVDGIAVAVGGTFVCVGAAVAVGGAGVRVGTGEGLAILGVGACVFVGKITTTDERVAEGTGPCATAGGEAGIAVMVGSTIGVKVDAGAASVALGRAVGARTRAVGRIVVVAITIDAVAVARTVTEGTTGTWVGATVPQPASALQIMSKASRIIRPQA